MQRFVGVLALAILVFAALAAIEPPAGLFIAAGIVLAPVFAKLIMSLAIRAVSRSVSAAASAADGQSGESVRNESSKRS